VDSTAAALDVILVLTSSFVVYRMMRIEIRATQDDVASIRGQVALMGRKVEAVVQSHNGARVMAESAILRAQHAEAVAGAAKKLASTPIVLVCKSANDAEDMNDKLKQ
jgi:hypothetical protein